MIPRVSGYPPSAVRGLKGVPIMPIDLSLGACGGLGGGGFQLLAGLRPDMPAKLG